MQTTIITIAPDERETVDLGGFGITWKIDGAETGERFSIVHHLLAPRALVRHVTAPPIETTHRTARKPLHLVIRRISLVSEQARMGRMLRDEHL